MEAVLVLDRGKLFWLKNFIGVVRYHQRKTVWYMTEHLNLVPSVVGTLFLTDGGGDAASIKCLDCGATVSMGKATCKEIKEKVG